MAISVAVPKDLSGIKKRVAFNLTARQLICFGIGGVLGVPIYFLTKDVLGTSAAALLMVVVMLPCFFFAMYEKEGMYAEEILKHMIRQKYILPGIRPYRSENIHEKLERRESIKKEVAELERIAKETKSKR